MGKKAHLLTFMSRLAELKLETGQIGSLKMRNQRGLVHPDPAVHPVFYSIKKVGLISVKAHEPSSKRLFHLFSPEVLLSFC